MGTVELVGDGSPSARLPNGQPKSVVNRDLTAPVLPWLSGKAGAEVGNRLKIIRLAALPSSHSPYPYPKLIYPGDYILTRE